MDNKDIVTINGQRYDAKTGRPINGKSTDIQPKKSIGSSSIHGSLQKSQTLIRRAIKKPTTVPSNGPKSKGGTMDIARSNKISRFAPYPISSPKPAVSNPDIIAKKHPMLTKVNAKHSEKQKPETKSSQEIKHSAIVAALAKPPVKTARRSFLQRHPRSFFISLIVIFVVIVGGYLTYLNLPGLSVRIAASQAGINATYPDYRPDGYKLDGPVGFSNGQVTINFVANTGTSKFSIKQSKSTWDSSAVLDNVVRPAVGEKYITNQEQGLTIYTYNGNATWVNGGILYNIEGDAPLSGDQLRHIATSL
jgi:hypothetical protein